MFPTKKPRALIIDDDAGCRSVLSRRLKNKGMVVDEAGDGEQGERSLLSKVYDVILLDIVMPILDGPSMLREAVVKGYKGKAPIVVMTNLPDFDRRIADAKNLGVVKVVVKSEISLTVLADDVLAMVGTGKA
ncbi:MAG: hypothetical protein RLZZ324_852 [Candidatus Parcubacteria bacterium]|jgi:DNA-binding response OmpR family regulator